MSVAKVIEITSASSESFEDAIRFVLDEQRDKASSMRSD